MDAKLTMRLASRDTGTEEPSASNFLRPPQGHDRTETLNPRTGSDLTGVTSGAPWPRPLLTDGGAASCVDSGDKSSGWNAQTGAAAVTPLFPSGVPRRHGNRDG